MSSAAGFAAYREDARREVERLLDSWPRSNSDILHQQLAHAPDVSLFAATTHLGFAGFLGANTAKALTFAGALGLLGLAAETLMNIAELAEKPAGAPELLGEWGLPLTLNAGDALFSLSQTAILDSLGTHEGPGLEEAGIALSILDRAGLDLAERARRRLADGPTGAAIDPGLASAATSLAAVAAGVHQEGALKAVGSFGEALALARAVDGSPDTAVASPVEEASRALQGCGFSQATAEALRSFARSVLGRDSP